MALRLHCLTVLASLLLLGGCATFERPAGGFAAPGSALHMVDPRLPPALMRAEFTHRLESTPEPLTLLSLSGGGANGAYGAGVIVGWTKAGGRPDFAIVTGVSTGALAAPFVYLGPDWDDELEAAYARGAAEGLLGWRHLAFLVSPSLFSARQLHDLVYKNVSMRLLHAVAVENAKGRRLLVATTNLDAEATTIWDMGVIASQGDAAALELFRKVLLASASVPGVFPPVFIVASGKDGRLVQQMHVDGAVNMSFVSVPEDLLNWTPPRQPPAGSTIYVLVNGQLESEPAVTRGRLVDILRRSFSSSGNSAARILIAANLAFAERNGMGMRLASIPRGVSASFVNFSEASMAALFEEGRSAAIAGTAWTDLAGSQPTSAKAPKGAATVP